MNTSGIDILETDEAQALELEASNDEIAKSIIF